MNASRFTKYEGLGNDFIVVERARTSAHAERDAELARRLCDRHFGVGADGLLFVDPQDPSMLVVNADGSIPEMCGNGLRCVALHYARRGAIAGHPEGSVSGEGHITIDTGAGPHDCAVRWDATGGDVVVQMAVPSLVPSDIGLAAREPLLDGDVRAGDRILKMTAVSMGNPHGVTFDQVASARLMLGPLIQDLELFANGVNVGFVSELETDASGALVGFRLDVLERGAGWTLACGTGACAAGVAAVETGRAPRGRPLRVTLPGGSLEITVQGRDERVSMRGPARHVFDLDPSERLLAIPKTIIGDE